MVYMSTLIPIISAGAIFGITFITIFQFWRQSKYRNFSAKYLIMSITMVTYNLIISSTPAPAISDLSIALQQMQLSAIWLINALLILNINDYVTPGPRSIRIVFSSYFLCTALVAFISISDTFRDILGSMNIWLFSVETGMSPLTKLNLLIALIMSAYLVGLAYQIRLHREHKNAALMLTIALSLVAGTGYELLAQSHNLVPITIFPIAYLVICALYSVMRLESKNNAFTVGKNEHTPNQQFNELLNKLPIAIFIVHDNRIRFGNQQMADMFGYATPELIVNAEIINFVAPDYRDRFRINTEHLLPSIDNTQHYHLHCLKVDGTTFVAEITLWPIQFNGQKAIQGSLVNITEQISAKQSLAAEMAFQQIIMDNIPDSIYYKDNESRFIRINKAYSDRLGLENCEEIIGRTDFSFFPEQQAQNEFNDEEKIRQTGKPLIGKTLKERLKSGKTRWLSSTKVPVRNRNGKIIGIVGISRDITLLKETEDALRNAKLAAEEANRAKGDFLANISHEIRTPMNGILGMTDLALSTSLTPQQRDYLTTVKTSADSLLILLNDILDFSRIDAGDITIDNVSFNLYETVEDAVSSLASQAHKKKLELLYAIQPDVPTQVKGDPLRIKQIILNILGNAVKFTETGQIMLRVRSVVTDDNCDNEKELPSRTTRIHVSISDTGIGMAAEKLDTIFESFSQIDGSRTRKYGGTGLGLAICKKLVTQMNGTIWAESTTNQGSTFHFILDLLREEQEEKHCLFTSQDDALQRAVLIIDDNIDSCEIISDLLVSWGFQPLYRRTAKEALQVMMEHKHDNTPYPIIFIDNNMPDMPFHELIGRIKELVADQDCYLIQMVNLKETADSIGPDSSNTQYSILKPMRQSELFKLLYEIRCSKTIILDKEQLHSWHILLAEDNIINQKVCANMLVKSGHTVDIANNGNEALVMLTQASYDLILMDIQMPEMDGIEATHMIRHSPTPVIDSKIPIIALTAHAQKGDREKFLDAQMDEYLSKPFNFNELNNIIERVMASRKINKQPIE
jgi:two-component system, sensor histidine kinase and response regulator